MERPTTRPGVTRPGTGGATTLPGNVTRPGETRPGITRPGTGGATTLPGNINRPGTGGATTLPGNVTRPGQRPIDPNRPIVRPPTNRPIINGNINNGNFINNNNIISNRPNWVNINNTTINNINNNWNQTIINRPGMHNYWRNNPARIGFWAGWGAGVRHGWHLGHYHRYWFGPSWWNVYAPPFGGWHYHYWLPYYPANYWWRAATWNALGNWFVWSNTPAWQQPIYYDYGTGGNVYQQNQTVYIGGQQVASTKDYAESAAVLATVPPPKDEKEAAATEWMPLGTFALSTGEKDTEPTRVVQLAVSKDGIVAGTLFNYQTDQSAAIQGKVDKETQRVAFRLGENEEVVAETGMYNLTQDEVPVLVHFGTNKTERYLFVRLQNEEEKK
jgi:hypothetical protein